MRRPTSTDPAFRLKIIPLLLAIAIPAFSQAQETGKEIILPTVSVSAQGLGETTEGTGSYTTGRTQTATPLSMSPRETPQSVSVVTQQRIEDQNFSNITDLLNSVTGVSVHQYETSRAQFTARGFDINTLMIDGVPTSTVSVESLRGSSPLRALSGRLPRRDDEIALSPDAAELLDAGVGDTVPITGPAAPGRAVDEGSRSVPQPRLRVVGVMFVPHTSHTDYTSGAVVTPGLTRRLVEAGAPLKLDAVVWSPTRGEAML